MKNCDRDAAVKKRLHFVKLVEEGLKDVEEGRVVSHEEVKKHFGLS